MLPVTGQRFKDRKGSGSRPEQQCGRALRAGQALERFGADALAGLKIDCFGRAAAGFFPGRQKTGRYRAGPRSILHNLQYGAVTGRFRTSRQITGGGFPFQVVKRDFNPGGLGEGNVIMEDQFEMMMHVRRNYYRDYLFDVIGMFADTASIDYERLSFGPGQRYMSKGCYIVQLSAGPKSELIKKSDWVIF